MDGYEKFIELCETFNLGKVLYSPKHGGYGYNFSLNDIITMKANNMIMDANDGGLVLGPLHANGGIQVLQMNEDGSFNHCTEMEGWEYITSSLITENEREELLAINEIYKNYDKNLNTEFLIPASCKIIDVSHLSMPVLLIDDYGRVIINRLSTKEYINRIIEIDNKTAP
ncbi:Uncharacterised protein [Chryseobacterium gleum]|uniref:Uncharacterized protein n=2 Tax=Chryseobacterium gleum TaxID=250 RepID=A0A3S4R5A7_CHRGE|nr:hypothetical protein [Chryseobacterium gleum]EFK36810.1 hypothetical protein HMPREF0204_11367 [Chryseobacterium gleum ATCC 35910]MCE4064345.1 hypothetical protein [Chryseobacterium gleum]QQY32064.1 hypothetical protein I6I60_25085 [Chryseobacterium gleum]VEE10715.1 Uncharacterised protein [Chryseobacterium gleum]